MEAWALLFAFNLATSPVRGVDMQNEDACVVAAKAITQALNVEALCLNAFDGRALWFYKGKQVER